MSIRVGLRHFSRFRQLIPFKIKDFSPIADAYVVAELPDENKGGLEYIPWGWSSDFGKNRALLKFDVNGLPKGYWLLYIYILYSSGASTTYKSKLYSILDNSWTEMGVTWNNQPAHVSLLVTLNYVAAGTWAIFSSSDLDTFVNDAIDAGGIVSFKVLGEEVVKWKYQFANSREAPSNTPYLRKQY